MKRNNKLPQIKKDIRCFLTDEDGKVNRKGIAKIAIGVMVIGIGIAGATKPDVADAACGHGSWSSY